MDNRLSRLFDNNSKCRFLLDVQCLCYGYDCEKLKFMCEILVDVYSYYVDGKQLYVIKSCQIQLSCPEDLLTCIVEYGDESVLPDPFFSRRGFIKNQQNNIYR